MGVHNSCFKWRSTEAGIIEKRQWAARRGGPGIRSGAMERNTDGSFGGGPGEKRGLRNPGPRRGAARGFYSLCSSAS